MPNTFITMQAIAARALATLYNTTVVATLIFRDYDPDFTGKVGDTVNVRVPAVFVADEFDRTQGIQLQDIDEDSFPVVLDTIADVSFAVTSEDMTLRIDDFATRILTPAMEAIAQKVDGDLAQEVIDAANASGGGGVVSNGSDPASSALIDARTALSRAKAPTSERYAILSPEGTGVALKDELFVQANKSGSTDALREASIGRVFGIDTYESQVLGEGSGTKGEADGAVFHRSAVALVSRTLEAPQGVATEQVAIENYKGLGLRVVKDYDIDKKQDVCSVDFLYGVDVVRKQLAIELDLGQGS